MFISPILVAICAWPQMESSWVALGIAPQGSGKEVTIPPPPRLRTARESFPSCSSSLRAGIQDSHFWNPRQPLLDPRPIRRSGIRIQDSHFWDPRGSKTGNPRQPLFAPPGCSSVARTPKPGAHDDPSKLPSDRSKRPIAVAQHELSLA
jgi:hypothetical protein